MKEQACVALVFALSFACHGSAAPVEPSGPAAATRDGSATPDEPPPTVGMGQFYPDGGRDYPPVVTGIPDCDTYLFLYRQCEETLAQPIAAGEMRTYEAEAASLRYRIETTEQAAVPAACREMERQLVERCR
jgi:hypothetical protein